jgi:hypothetical protein
MYLVLYKLSASKVESFTQKSRQSVSFYHKIYRGKIGAVMHHAFNLYLDKYINTRKYTKQRHDFIEVFRRKLAWLLLQSIKGAWTGT